MLWIFVMAEKPGSRNQVFSWWKWYFLVPVLNKACRLHSYTRDGCIEQYDWGISQLLYRSRNILCQVFVYCEREDHCRQLRDSRGNLICALISTKGCDDYWFVQSVFDIWFYWCLRGTRIRAYVVESFEVCTTIWRDPGESLGRASKLDENSIYKFLRKYCFLLWYSIQHCLSC